MTVSDDIKTAEGLGKFFRNFAKTSTKAAKKLANNVINPSRDLETGAKVGKAAASENL